ncbi:MAG: UDP-N-acetylmuramoyl-L-alanine--D-glutamate ligase [Polyangiales bacterium]
MELSGKTVLIVGLGASGLAAARFAHARGAKVVLNDKAPAEKLPKAVALAAETGAELLLGDHPADRFTSADLIVVSPGVPRLAALVAAEEAGVEIVGEISLAARFLPGKLVGITGTNGKSTVTTLVGEMVAKAGRKSFTGGNLGTPMIEAVGTPAADADGIVVAELSSFQLETAADVRCHVAVLLNVTDDHLDRYDSFGDYAAAKAKIFHAQRKGDVAIVPDGDELCLSLARVTAGEVLTFGGEKGVVREKNGRIVDARGGLDLPVSELGIQGGHNVLNACAAALAARAAGVPTDVIAEVLRTFKGLKHRMVLVRTLDGIRYFDDSKATNVGATVAALDGFASAPGKVVLVAGGVDKGGSYAPVRERMERLGRAVVLIGAAAPLIRNAFEGSPLPLVDATTMEDAVAKCRALAKPGDVVLLAPACASFDMFTSYAHRGDVFTEAVRALGEGGR